LQCWLLARRLAQVRDLRVTLYVADVGQGERSDGNLLIRPLVRVDKELRLSSLRAVRLVLRLACARHAIYVTRSASGVNGLVWIASRVARGKHVHFCAHDRECAGGADATLSPPARRLHRLAMRRADVLICQTEAQRRMLLSHLRREAVVAPNLPPPPAPVANEARSGALWVGRDVDWKRPELFIELARRLPGERFTMVCQPQPGRKAARLREAAPPNLALHEGLPFEETAQLFAAHRVLVITSSEEGLPNVMLQAAQASTPIVTIRVDPDGLIGEHGAGFVCGDLESATGATRLLLTDEEVWRSRSDGAARLAGRMLERAEDVVELLRSHARAEGPEEGRSSGD